MRKFEIAD